MADTLQNVNLPVGVWVDLYDKTSIPVGTQVTVENLATQPVRLYSGVTPPISADNDNGTGSFSRLMSYGEKQNSAGDVGMWAMAELGGLVNVRVYISEGFPVGAFEGFRALNTQSYTESNIKLGVQHEASVLISGLPGNSSNNTIWETGSKPVILKSRSIGFSGLGITASIFEGATYSGGTILPLYNPNAINPVPSQAIILSGATIISEGTLIFAPEHLIGSASQQGKGSSTRPFGQERIMKPNTTYLFRLTSLDPQAENVTSLVSWFEGDPDLPLP